MKTALTIDEQICLLERRGLCVEDREYARKVLSNVNYYHLEGYWYPFYDNNKPDHFFYDNIYLLQTVRYFEFDNSLRIIVFDAISRIEISVRTRFIYEVLYMDLLSNMVHFYLRKRTLILRLSLHG